VRIFVIFMMALGFFSIPPSLVMARELVYAPLPIENQATVVGSHAPMIQYLAEKLGVTIRIRYEKDNNRTVQLFKEGKIDLIQLGPLPYVTLKKEYARTLPLVIFNEADGKPFYTCALVTSFDGPPSVGEINSPLALTQFFPPVVIFLRPCFSEGIISILKSWGMSIWEPTKMWPWQLSGRSIKQAV